MPQQGRRRHDDVRAGQEVSGHVGRLLDAGGRRERGVTRPRRSAIHVRGSRASAGLESSTAGTTARVSGSMSGWRNRLNSTSPSAPASSNRSAISPVELKCGLELHRHRHGHRVLDPRQDVDVALLDIPAGDVRVAGKVVDVQLDRGGAGILHRPGVAGPPAGGDAVEAADHRNVDGGRGALEQAQVAARAGLLFGRVREVRQRLCEGLGAGVGELRIQRRLTAQLLLEERGEDHRADAGVGEAPYAIDGLRQRGRDATSGLRRARPM